MLDQASKIVDGTEAMYVIVAMPKCDEYEQKIISYAKSRDECVQFLPLTMFDINSFRRLQNVLLRQIVMINKSKCPCCGQEFRRSGNQMICYNCSQLTITKMQCPNPECKHEYVYLSYDVSNDTLEK